MTTPSDLTGNRMTLTRYLLWPTVFFALLTIFMTWPLAANMASSVFGYPGDNFYYVWLIGWYQKALLELQRSPLFVPFLNYPEGWSLTYTEITPAMVFIAFPVSISGGPTFGYNFSIIVSFVLSGLGVYVWVYRLTKQHAASLIAGTIFAFAPYRMAHAGGHLNLTGTQWFPFYFMSLDDLLQSRRRSRKSVILSAMFLGLIGFTSQYYLYMTLMISCAYIAGYLLLIDRKAVIRALFWVRVATFVLVSLPLVFFSIAPYLQQVNGAHVSVRSFEEVRIWSASPTDFIRPLPQQPFSGRGVRERFGLLMGRSSGESGIYVGTITLILAVCAFARRKPKQVYRHMLKLFVWTGLFAFILALGTDFHWLGEPVIVDVPQFIQQWHPYSRTFIPLPGYFLYKFLPFYGLMRVWTRYAIFVNLFVSMLAGLGIMWLWSRVNRRWIVPLTVIILMLILIDFSFGSLDLSTVEGRPVDVWLAAQPGNGAVVQFPIWQLVRQPQLVYYTNIHHKPFVGADFGPFSPPQFRRIQPILDLFPDEQSLVTLRELGVQYVVIEPAAYPNFAETQVTIESLGLHLRGKFGEQYVFEIPEHSTRGGRLPLDDSSFNVLGTQGWGIPEDWGRWAIGQRSIVRLALERGHEYHLAIEAFPFCPPQFTGQSIKVSWNDYLLGTHQFTGCGSSLIEFNLSSAMIAEGLNTLKFEFEKSAAPADFGLSGDRRSLAVGFNSITLTQK